MGTYFINEEGNRVGLCPTCNKIKPDYMLREDKRKSNQFIVCYECNRDNNRRVRQEWAGIRHNLLSTAGGCVWPGCHMRYPRDFSGNFALDHIDPTLKTGPHETQASWVMAHLDEFWERIVPNLQVLCQHHNGEKYSVEAGVGGALHTNPWDEQEDEVEIVDFDEVALMLPGMEEFANPLT